VPLKRRANLRKGIFVKRISLVLAAALACLLLASVGTAAAMPTEGIVNTSCSTTSKNVIGKKVTATVTGKNVASSQMEFAECKIVKKVVNKMTSLRIEKPKVFEGYRCTPTVLTTGQGTEESQVVKYSCLFRGADTATEIRVKFKVTYNQD
jgi:phosphoglycerol transferase MdoB-like AlkP superfamily enzyme